MGSLATGPDAGAGAGILGRIFGPDVTGVAIRLDGPEPEATHEAEARLVAGAVARRRHEFLAGRACAHAALATIGRDDSPILAGPRREPIWPPGVVGSIAHGGNCTAAVVAPADQVGGLGVDIEPLDPPLPPEVTGLALTAAEGRRLPASHADAHHWAKVVFTAKECVYKALYPSTGWLLEYADVEIDLDLDTGRFRATLAKRFPWPGPGLAGRFEIAHDHIFTGILCAGSNIQC